MRRIDAGTWRGRLAVACIFAFSMWLISTVLDALVWGDESWRDAATGNWPPAVFLGVIWFAIFSIWPDAFKPERQSGE